MTINNEKEKMVYRLAMQTSNWIIGGYENAVADKEIDEMPELKEIIDTVYHDMIRNPILECNGGMIQLKKDIRFIGTARLTEIAEMAVKRVLKIK